MYKRLQGGNSGWLSATELVVIHVSCIVLGGASTFQRNVLTLPKYYATSQCWKSKIEPSAGNQNGNQNLEPRSGTKT